jgi:hypothetical protein
MKTEHLHPALQATAHGVDCRCYLANKANNDATFMPRHPSAATTTMPTATTAAATATATAATHNNCNMDNNNNTNHNPLPCSEHETEGAIIFHLVLTNIA